jgi:hypothetical protein
MLFRSVIWGLFLVMAGTIAAGQVPDDTSGTIDTLKSGSPENKPEISAGIYADRPLDTARTQNPTAALFKSMFVPGLGQLGNKKYIKAAVIVGIEGSLIAAIIHNADRARDAKSRYDNNTNTSLSSSLYSKYESARDDRNFYGWMTGLTIFISMFDAYVDAHLAGFPKYDKGLVFDLGPDSRSILAARLSYNF